MTLISLELDPESDEITIDGIRFRPSTTFMSEIGYDFLRATSTFKKLIELRNEVHQWRHWAAEFARWEAQRPPVPSDWTR